MGLRRLFQSVDLLHADETPTKAGIDKLDRLRFRDFLKDIYKIDLPDRPEELLTLLQNMNLACDDGMLNLAGALLFAEKPEWIKPEFMVKLRRFLIRGVTLRFQNIWTVKISEDP